LDCAGLPVTECPGGIKVCGRECPSADACPVPEATPG
jgi:hypothetical protein